MHIAQLFWFALTLPGFVIVRRFFKEELECGLIGTIGLSYIAVFTLLSPISIACYLLELPVWVLSVACLIMIFLAPIEISRQRWWGDMGKLLLAAASIQMLIVVADMVLGGLAGGHVRGDAMVHLGRIRFLLDHGLNNRDPCIPGDYFYPIYHTNLLHALYAACAQITKLAPVQVWFAGLPWTKLVIASGSYYLGWSVFGRRWAAWAVAIFVIGVNGPVPFLLYPNKLAPLWIFPIVAAFAIQAAQPNCSWKCCVKMAAGCLLLGQVHGLYALFMIVAFGPVLGAVGLAKWIRHRPDRWRYGVCLIALLLGSIFPAISKWGSASSGGSTKDLRAIAEKSRFLNHLDDGKVVRKARGGFNSGRFWRVKWLGVGVICALLGRRRRHAAVLIAAVATVAVIYFVPTICTAALRAVGRDWILARLEFVTRLGLYCLLPGSLVFLLESFLRGDGIPIRRPSVRALIDGWAARPRLRWCVRAAVCLLVLYLSIVYRNYRNPKNKYTWKAFYTLATTDRIERRRRFDYVLGLADFLPKHVPPGATILTNQVFGMSLVAMYDCRIVAPVSASMGVRDLSQRRRDLRVMRHSDTPWPVRLRLLKKYDARYFIPTQKNVSWPIDHVKGVWKMENGPSLARLRLDDT